ncbi:MAG: tRNA lysidine(34) synthetase TilS [Devosia sp.]
MSGAVGVDAGRLFAPVAAMDKIGLAVSGGPDSLALMLVAAEWAKAPGRPRLFVYSVDHGLRPEAKDEAQMVKREAERLGIAARVLRWTGDKPSTGVQAAARAARYALMGEAMAMDGVETLLTAHQLEDQAETVLMRMAHGSGIEGLKAMMPLAMVEGLVIFRPFLAVPKAELMAVVERAGLTPACDPSNDDAHYERVRWRTMLPQLATLGLTPQRLAMMAMRLSEADEAIASAAAVLIAKHAERSARGMVLSLARLRGVPRAVAIRALGRALDEIGGAGKAHDLGSLEVLYSRLASGEAMKPTTLHGCVIAAAAGNLTIRRESVRTSRRKVQEKATAR